MPFGYVPQENAWKDFIRRITGTPVMIRRFQAPVIMRMLNCSEEDLILDLGCGDGSFAYEIGKLCRCIGVDHKIRMALSYAMGQRASVWYMKAGAERLPFKTGTFDKILLSSVLQMVEEDRGLLDECYRILRKDGEITLSVPEQYLYLRGLNKRRGLLVERFGAARGYYRRVEVIEMLESGGYEVLQIEYSPKRIGSLLYEAQLYWQCLNLSPLMDMLPFLLLYPVGRFDRYDSRHARGCELIVRAKATK